VAQPASQKHKKNSQPLSLSLIENPDIIAAVASAEHRPAMVIGFAAETENLATYAKTKLKTKKLDMIAANLVAQGKVFGSDQNALQVYWPDGERQLPLAPKTRLAQDLMDLITEHYHAKDTT
jgi:phosphopantothenoylcysteine decarboxylase/phosphopantothenate--cysteine ligase